MNAGEIGRVLFHLVLFALGQKMMILNFTINYELIYHPERSPLESSYNFTTNYVYVLCYDL